MHFPPPGTVLRTTTHTVQICVPCILALFPSPHPVFFGHLQHTNRKEEVLGDLVTRIVSMSIAQSVPRFTEEGRGPQLTEHILCMCSLS